MTAPAQPGSSSRQRAALLVWVAAAVALFWLAPSPPEPTGTTPAEEAARVRLVEWAVADARRWQQERGDITIPWVRARGHLAIVIDDVGRELQWQEELQDLRFPLTFSVLPGAVYAPGAQLRLRQDHRRYREIMLHLPMEPMDPTMMARGPEAAEEFLLSSDSPLALTEKLERALERVPAAVGVNNHMGSRLTTQTAAMGPVMEVLAQRGLFFVDSRTSAQTVAETVARAHGVPTAARNVFLDHDPDPAAIRRAFEEAVEGSLTEPTIVIAHPSQAVVDVLRTELPRLVDEDVGVYPVSQLLARVHAQGARG